MTTPCFVKVIIRIWYYVVTWQLRDEATVGIGMIVAVDAWRNQAGLEMADRSGATAQTRPVSMLAGSQ
jgi:hypothetical protein